MLGPAQASAEPREITFSFSYAQIDYLAVSFAESRADIEEARAFLDRCAAAEAANGTSPTPVLCG